MKVVYIGRSYTLKYGDIYTVVSETDNLYHILWNEDTTRSRTILKKFFLTLGEWREMRINKILKEI
jgi:hypothetical protein